MNVFGVLAKKTIVLAAVLTVLGAVAALPVFAQTAAQVRPLITQGIDEHRLITLTGNTRPEMQPANDRGVVRDSLALEHMYLLLKRSPEKQQAVEDLIDKLHDAQSAQYRQWLTADQIAAQFGPAEEDIQTVSSWLTSHGFTVNVVYRVNGVIDFSGTAGSVRKAFHTEIHNLEVNGKSHIANASDPAIPTALAPAVQGVMSLHDFRPRAANRLQPQYTFTANGQTLQAVVPGDLHTIYNTNPLYDAGISGRGQTIVVIEDSNVYSTADWNRFRKTFGLAERFPHGSLTQIHPQPSTTCANPGVNGDDFEAQLDAEWASAAAPDAAIVVASCANTNTNFGGFIAMQNLLTGRGPVPAIISIGYGAPETGLLAGGNAYINRLYEIAVLEGVSVFVAAGDDGADATDYFASAAVSGINVSGFASTPHNVAVGGTDFGDTYLNENAAYWNPTNGRYFNSARSYIPEIPWNDSCASQLITNFAGYPKPYGKNGFCNSALGEQFLSDVAGGGGPSGCAFGSPIVPGVVSGTCQGYGKPFYQGLAQGNPKDGVRDLPDVSLFAANGVWGHYYVVCFSDQSNGGAPCVGAPSSWAGGGGTSFGAPILAGIQAMINQTAGGRQGNPNFVYYALAAFQHGFGGNTWGRNAKCNSTLGRLIDPSCIFHDVTLGDSDVNCLPLVIGGHTIGTFNCYLPSGTNGVLSLSNSSYEPAYRATAGWDFATGLGSVNAYNLVRSWPGSHVH